MIQLVCLLALDLFLSHVYQGDMKLASYVTNTISHALLSMFSMGVYLSAPDMELDSKTTELELFCGEWLKWYFVVDLGRMFVGTIRFQDIFVAHHLVGIALIVLIEHSGMLHRYIPVICLFEISSVPLNVRYALLHSGEPKMSRQVIFSEVAFFLSFIVVRWGFGFNKAYAVLMELHEIEDRNRLQTVVIYTTTIVLLLFLIMHVHWTFGIVKRVVKYIKKYKNMRKQYIPTNGQKCKTP